MAKPTLRDLATVIFRDLMRPTYAKLVALAFLFVASITAEHEGYLVLGRPGNNPIPVVIFALLVGSMAQGARMGLFWPIPAAPRHRIVVVLSLMAIGALVVAATGAPPVAILMAWLFVLMVALAPRQDSGAPLTDDDRIDCPVCDGHGYLLDDDDSEVECEQCGGSGKVLAQTDA
jgi:hypothetical protein